MEQRRKRDVSATRAFVRLCDKAKCSIDHYTVTFDADALWERLQHYKGARGYSLAHVARVIADYRDNCKHPDQPAEGPHTCPECGMQSFGMTLRSLAR